MDVDIFNNNNNYVLEILGDSINTIKILFFFLISFLCYKVYLFFNDDSNSINKY